MNTKFEEAKYIKGTVAKMYSVEEISEIRQNNLQLFSAIKEYIFCPECDQPQLTHNLCQNKHDYLSTRSGQFHVAGCSYECEKATKKILTNLSESKNLNNLHTRLQNCLLLLMKVQTVTDNPFIICKETDNCLLRESTTTQIVYEKQYYIPRKRLTRYMDDSIVDDFRIFYGEAELKWRKINGYYSHWLNIYHGFQKGLICSLGFSNNIYSHLPLECKQIGVGIRFRASVAFYTKLTTNTTEIKTDSGIENKTYYNGIINDSRKISFLDILPVD